MKALPEVCADISRDFRGDVAPATLMNELRYLCAAARWGWRKHNMGDSNPAGRVIFPSVRNERQVARQNAEGQNRKYHFLTPMTTASDRAGAPSPPARRPGCRITSTFG